MRERRRYRAVLIGASSGGIAALRAVLGSLRPGFRTPIIIVVHTGAESLDGLCDMLAAVSPSPVTEARERHPVRPGRAYLAPSGYHLLVEKDQRFALSVDEKVCYVRPAVDVLFESAALVWRHQLIGVVLTGANDDGARGLSALRARGGVGIVQSPAEAEFPEMPSAALSTAGADYVLPLAEIGPLLNRLCGAATAQA